MKQRRWLLVLLAAVLVLGAACGSDDDESGDSDAASNAGAETESPAGEETEGSEGGGVTVTAVDFAFQLDSTTIPAGETKFILKNEGKELHELGMVGLKEGAPDITELAKMSDKEAQKFFATPPFGTEGPIEPGDTTSFTQDLKPGTYAMVCFVQKDGKPHVALGMFNSVTVE